MSNAVPALGCRRRSVSQAATALSVLGLGLFLWRSQKDLGDLSFHSGIGLGALLFGLALNLTSSQVLNHRLLRGISIDVGWRESLATTWIGTMLNSVLPARAGTAYRAAHFRSHHNTPLSVFSSAVLAYLLSTVAVGSAATLIALRGEAFNGRNTALIDGLAILGIGVTSALLLGAQFNATSRWGPLEEFLGASKRLVGNPIELAGFAALGLLQIASSVVALWGSVAMIGGALPFGHATAIGSVGAMSSLIAITPGNLGIYEATVGATAAILATPAAVLVTAALTQRLVLILILAIGLPVARRLLPA